jgi:cell division septation protein DedD
MSLITRASSQVLVLAALLLAGCAADGSTNFFTTGALGTAETAAAPEPKVDPACVSLVSRIEALRKEGVADKIEKAAAKKYKMTSADLAKADQLTKANADFQLRCSTIMPKPMQAQVSSSPSAVAVAAPPPAAKARTPKAAANTTNTPANSEN